MFVEGTPIRVCH